ncbi:Alpha/Beta hydrolase fold [Trinorchestia longiramus]|nr:Alpha/Beta hydrolase fold [Trinorchestia longiramus]
MQPILCRNTVADASKTSNQPIPYWDMVADAAKTSNQPIPYWDMVADAANISRQPRASDTAHCAPLRGQGLLDTIVQNFWTLICRLEDRSLGAPSDLSCDEPPALQSHKTPQIVASNDGPEKAPEGFAGFDNVVRVHGHPLPVNGYFKAMDVAGNATGLGFNVQDSMFLTESTVQVFLSEKMITQPGGAELKSFMGLYQLSKCLVRMGSARSDSSTMTKDLSPSFTTARPTVAAPTSTLLACWLVVISVIYGVMGGSKDASGCWGELKEHLIGYFVLLFSCIVVEALIAYVAMRGTILDPEPRASMQYLLYVRLVLLTGELVWVILGVVWLAKHYRDCTHNKARDVILGIVVCNWCVLLSVLITVCCTFDTAGRSWVKMKKYQRSMRTFPNKRTDTEPYKTKRSRCTSGNANRNWRHRKVMKAYQDSWDQRCRMIFCCVNTSDSYRNSFGDIARLLSEFFRDLDVVPSDVVAGLVLLRKCQKMERKYIVKNPNNDVHQFLSGVPITAKTRFLQLSTPEGEAEFKKIVHYMRFALAVYGWLMYVMRASTGKAACQLCPELRCCSCSGEDSAELPYIVEDNCCWCNTAALFKMAPADDLDLIYATFHVDIGETPFFVALDHSRKAVVISIRGTLSMKVYKLTIT